MNIRPLVLVSGVLVLSVLGAPARAEVTVEFIASERYTDAGRYGRDVDHTLDTIQRHLQALGKRCLTVGQTVNIRVYDIDLAGQHEWWRPRAYDARFMRAVTWPRMDIDYARKDADGAVLSKGRERISDMEYLSRSAYVRFDPDPLVYDKTMLTEWFERRFCRDAG